MNEREMPATELLDMHLAYGPGDNHHIDAEVWRRWPDLQRIYGQQQIRQREFAEQRQAERGFDLLDMEPMPGQVESYEAFLREYKTAVQAIKDAQ